MRPIFRRSQDKTRAIYLMNINSEIIVLKSQATELAPGESEIIKQVTTLHDRLLDYSKKSLADAIEAGELLTSLKAARPHGEWLTFVKLQLPFEERTARRYMWVCEHREELLSKSDTVSDLTLKGAYRLLNKPREKDPVAKGKNDNFLPPGVKLDHDDAPCDDETGGGPVIDVDVEVLGEPATLAGIATPEGAPPTSPANGSGDAASAVPEGPHAPEPAVASESGEAPPEADLTVRNEKDFPLADGTTMPFDDWFRSTTIRNSPQRQLK
jgi:hypothetical protein